MKIQLDNSTYWQDLCSKIVADISAKRKKLLNDYRARVASRNFFQKIWIGASVDSFIEYKYKTCYDFEYETAFTILHALNNQVKAIYLTTEEYNSLVEWFKE